MYKFKPISPRVSLLRDLARNRIIPVDSERAVAITESYKRNETVTPIIKRARATSDILQALSLQVEDFELFVGSMGAGFCGAGIYPEWTGESWIPEYIENGAYRLSDDGLYHTPVDDVGPLTVAPEVYVDLKGIAPYWKNRVATAPIRAWAPEGFDAFQQLHMSSYTPEKDAISSPVGHLTPGHEKIIKVGYGALRRQAQDWLDARRGRLMGDDIDKCLFYTAVTIVCDAASDFIKRYGKLCREKAKSCDDEARKAELYLMADGLDWISERPARTFREACQAAILYHLVLQLEAGYPALAFGRFDQYTGPFLEADLKAGRITLDGAQELVDAVFLKMHTLYRVFPPVVTASTGVNTYYHTTIGGVNRDTGEDATNPVTYMALESIGRLSLHDPTISLRVNRNTPDELWECAIETSKLVGGLPLFQNDEVIIPALRHETGFSLRDARDYSLIGCQEIVGSGNDFPAPNGYNPPHCSVHYGTIFAMAINDGLNPSNNKQCEVHTGYLYEMGSIDEVKAAVEKLCRYAIHWLVTMNNYTECISKSSISHPLLSISVEGCMETGRDIVAGGAKYNSFGGTATGLATIADSLATIKYMCFDRKLCTTRELYDAVMDNWEGHEQLRQRILREAPHYGNGDPYADEMMAWITSLYYDICRECYSSRAKVYKSGLYGATDHINQGYITWATPDGRRSGEPLADATSPAQGRDRNGPTAVFRSSCCFDHHKFMDGIALNIRVHPSSVNTEDGVMKLRDMTKAYFANGGMETQYNIVSTETLRAAQADPETYRDLVVRIAGFSAYFVELTKDGQDDVIRRNENYV
jgi:formate C-acetyltransferase